MSPTSVLILGVSLPIPLYVKRASAAPRTGIDSAPKLTAASLAGEIVSVRLQNTGPTAEASGYVTFGQVFARGAVMPGDSVVARINGVNYAVQMDVKSTNADGSVRQAVLTLQVPSIAANGSVDLMLAKGSAAAPLLAPTIADLQAKGYDTRVSFTFHNSDGTTTSDTASAATVLSSGSVQKWLAGPGVNEYDVVTTVDGGKLKVEFDIRAYADGSTSTSVIFDNSWMFQPGKSDLNYDVAITQGGSQVYSATGVYQWLYSMWHHQVDSAGRINPNVQYDLSYLISTGAIPNYDRSFGVSDSAIQGNYKALNAKNTGPLGTALVTTYMPQTGGRPDIGIQPNWVAQWLLSQNSAAWTVMMANADASGGIPWHLTDENTGKPINGETYPKFWLDKRNVSGSYWTPQPANGWKGGSPWTPDAAHLPDLNYVPYLTTGSHYRLTLLQAEANYANLSLSPYYKYWSSDVVDPTHPGSAVYLGVASPGNQQRAIAWSLRELAEAAYITPDNDRLKNYFVSELNSALSGLVKVYVTNAAEAAYGEISGFLFGTEGNIVAPWQQHYIVTALAEIAGMKLGTASDDAVTMLKFMNNFVAGLYTNGDNGYNPFNGEAYWLYIQNSPTATPYATWANLQTQNILDSKRNSAGWGLSSANPTSFSSAALDMDSGYPILAKAALADLITYTQSPRAIQAYGFVVSQIANVWATKGGSQAEAAAWQRNPEWSIAPQLPDGVLMRNSRPPGVLRRK